MIEVAVDESATHKLAIDQLGPTEVATDEYAVLKFRVSYNSFLEADIGECAALEAALLDLLLVELCATEDAVMALERARERGDLLPPKVDR